MKSTSLLLTLLLCFFSLAPGQTKKTTKKKTATPTSPVNDATRARRTDQKTTTSAETPATTPAESKPETTDKPKEETQVAKPASAATPTSAEEVVPNSTENSEPTEAAPSDPVADLKAKIEESNRGAERVRLQVKLADELLSQGNKAEAISLLHTVTNTDAFDPQTFYNTGNALARLGDNDGAIEAYRKAIDQRKGSYSRALNNLGVVLLRLGRWDESHEALSSALKLENFHYPEASYNLGRLYAARGQKDLAVREWKRVLALDPMHAGAVDALAHVGNDEGVVVEQVQVSSPVKTGPAVKASNSSKAVALDASSYNYLQQARTLNEKGNASGAIENYQRVLAKQNGYFPLANLEMSFALLSLKRYDEALNNLQMVAERDGSRYPISYFHLARVYETKGDLKLAENWYSRAVTAFGNKNNQFLLDVSRVREKQSDYSGALQAMEQYITLMQQQGLAPSWSDERLTALKQKVAAKQ